jgi:hypothetical protein
MNERRNVPEIVIGPANCFADPKLGSISSLRCQKSRMPRPLEDATCEVMFRGRNSLVWRKAGRRPLGPCRARFALRLLRGRATPSPKGEAWWSQTGSNRRPHACKARALPAELWPRTRRRMLQARRKLNERHMRSIKVVGLGRLELPTSRLSSARSNQLSYKPLHKERARAHGVHAKCVHADVSHKPSPWRVFVREERETKTAKSRQWSSTIWRSMAPDVSKTIR